MMKKKINSIIALCVLVCVCALALACCGFGRNNEETTVPTESTEAAKPMNYTVQVLSEGGVPISGVGVYVYADDTRQELVWFAKTDETGMMSFMGVEGDSLIAVLEGIPEGYAGEASYIIDAETTLITLLGGLAEVDDLESVQYKLGDKIHDFTVTAPDGTEYGISQLLKEKKAVILNFWYVQCEPCRAEFPYMQEAYEQYSQLVEIVAMNPVNSEPEEIAEFQEEMGLSFPMAGVEQSWEKAMQITAYPTTVVIDRTGTIALIHKGTIPDTQTFINIFDFFSAEDYQPTLVKDVDDLPVVEDTIGTMENPYEFGGVSTFDVQVRPGKTVYVNIYKANNLYMQISDSDAYVIYEDTIYYPSNGKVGLVIKAPDTFTPVSLQIGNSGKTKETFTANLGQFPGTLNNPFDLELGSFATTVNAGNDQGVYYSYTAPADGVMRVTCTSATSGVNFDFALYNLDSYVYRNKGEDGQTDDEGRYFVQVEAKQGQTIQFSVGTLPDSSNNYPGGTFGFLAEFDEGASIGEQDKEEQIKYSITVTDENRVPMKGVFFNLTVDGQITSISTNENGVATVKMPAGIYDATLVLPEGYICNTTDYLLTEYLSAFTVMLEKFILVTHEYTVKVVDEAGTAVSGALVSVGSSFAYTDENGKVSFTLNEGDYKVLISPPAGFTADQGSHTFEKGKTELTITLKEVTAEEEETQMQDYTVTVKDYSGNTKTGIVVQFMEGENPVAMQAVDESGIAKVQLKPGKYDVRLVFSGETMYYSEKKAVVSADSPNVEILLASAFAGEKMALYVGDAPILSSGGTYVTMQANAMNYFVFSPEVSGTYKFTTSDAGAVLSYWGGSTSFIQDMTGGTDYSDNAFSLNIKESNLGGVVILGITGADHCIVEISRTGEAELDETDIEPMVYEAKTAPMQFTLSAPSGKTLKYVDLTASQATAVYSEADGYYHLNREDGPVLYMDLGENAPYISMYRMLGFTGFGGTSLNKSFYDENGEFVKKEDYTECMCAYVECIDEGTGLYPLTEDLIYMVQNGGEYKGWWEKDNPSYMFADLEGFNPTIGWMYACCYYE